MSRGATGIGKPGRSRRASRRGGAAWAGVPVRLVAIAAFLALVAVPAIPTRAPASSAEPGAARQRPSLQDPDLPQPDDPGDDGGDDPGVNPPPEPEPESPAVLPVPPDSLRPGFGNTIPVGGAPAETLGFKPPRAAGQAPASVKPKTRRPPFGLHPAAIFALLVVAHVFVVRAATD